MQGIASSLGQLIGGTPILSLDRLSQRYQCQTPILAKLELFNPSGSVKDRSVWAMVRGGMDGGRIGPGTLVIESTSGNSGVSLAMVCAALGLRAAIVMPDSVPPSRVEHIRVYGAQAVLFPAREGLSGAQDKVRELMRQHPDHFLLSQFDNEDNCLAHRETTAKEIVEAVGPVDYFVAGAGSGGTITGVGEILKSRNTDCRVIAVEPVDSPVLSGGFPGSHILTGIGPGFVPENLNVYILDEVIKVRTPDSIELLRALAQTEGLLCGLSSGAALAAAVSVARRPEARGKRLLTILPDTGERYLDILRER